MSWLRYLPMLVDLIKAIQRAKADPAVELSRIRQSYEAKARGEEAWARYVDEKFGAK